MAQIDAEALKRLAAKLDGLELSEVEQAMLDSVFDRAAAFEPDVEGFAFSAIASSDYSGLRSGAGLEGTSLKLGGGLGFVTRPDLGYKAGARDGTSPPPP